jgi:hypothetical protein
MLGTAESGAGRTSIVADTYSSCDRREEKIPKLMLQMSDRFDAVFATAVEVEAALTLCREGDCFHRAVIRN